MSVKVCKRTQQLLNLLHVSKPLRCVAIFVVVVIVVLVVLVAIVRCLGTTRCDAENDVRHSSQRKVLGLP